MMKIGPVDNKAAQPTQAADRKPNAGAAAPTPTPEPSAKVELSAAAGVIASGVEDGTFDAQKVERLSQAIRDGNYRIDAQAIADQLIANATDLLTPKAE